mmetsp:Transcript_8818/g.16123  ORF Transcript_8818/g.16123 Transcript_8818/m.16123 type:complete len:110 (+) Transcript_8818:1395-1724(+)
MGRVEEFQASICFWLRSTTQTRTLGQFAAMTAMVGPPTYPAPMQQIVISNPSLMLVISWLFWKEGVGTSSDYGLFICREFGKRMKSKMDERDGRRLIYLSVSSLSKTLV